MKKHFILFFLALNFMFFLGCKFQNQENISNANAALLAHKSFASTVNGQTLSTYITHLNQTLAPDQKFLQTDDSKLSPELIEAKTHLKLARQDWLDFFDCWGKKKDPKQILDEMTDKIANESKREMDRTVKQIEENRDKKLSLISHSPSNEIEYYNKRIEILEETQRELEIKTKAITNKLASDFDKLNEDYKAGRLDDGNSERMKKFQESANFHISKAEESIKKGRGYFELDSRSQCLWLCG